MSEFTLGADTEYTVAMMIGVEFENEAWDAIWPPERAMETYEVANCFKRDNILLDYDGLLGEILAFGRENFAKPHWVRARLAAVFAKMERGMAGFPGEDLLDCVNPWLFPAGLCCHAVLVAALQNPTVRLRYLRAREALDGLGRPELYPGLLDLLGCTAMTQGEVSAHLAPMAAAFDDAARLRLSPFPFQDDISQTARKTAVDAAYGLIAQGDHREAVFWLVVAYERSLRILRANAPTAYAAHLPGFMALLEALGLPTREAIGARLRDIRAWKESFHQLGLAAQEDA